VRKDLLTAPLAGTFVIGFVLLLGNATGLLFGRQGPFDLRSMQEEWSLADGTEISSRSEVLTFRNEDLFTVRSYDGTLPPDLRTAPIPDSLNRVARAIREGASAPLIVAEDVPGLDIEIVRRGGTGEGAFLIRVTPDDAAAERSRGDSAATVEAVAERWRSALEDAFRSVSESGTPVSPGGHP
jgi:hypothetical protein